MIEAGKVLQNRYVVEKHIGAGGMGNVYVATDQRFGTKVAIKETLFTDANLRRAFEREAQILNGLRHSALPRVSDHFTEGNGAFIVMEFIAGEDLSEMVERDGAFAVKDVLRWADDLLDALDYMHTQKTPIVHRDIKPQNLKLSGRGEIILLDFGLAKGSISELTQASQTKSIFGYSKSYAPLEQIQGTGTDPRSDLYSVAATLYHLLTGKPPVDALTRATSVLNGDGDPLHPAHHFSAKIPVSVSEALQKAMSLNSNLRPATAAKMRLILNDAAANPHHTETSELATILAAPTADSQKTELMDSTISDSGEETKIAPAAGETNPQPDKATAPLTVAAAANTTGGFTQRRRTFAAPVGIAAAIAVFGGGGFAAWYALNPTAFAPPTQIQTIKAAPEQKPVAETVTTTAAQTEPSPVSNANTTAAPTNPPTDKSATVAAKPGEPNKSETGKGRTVPTPPQTPAAQKPETPVMKDEPTQTAGGRDPRKPNFDEVPPEIRSNDPNNPVDREKLRIYIEKNREEAMRKIREANRKRAEQGLPPLNAPRPLNKRRVPPPPNQQPSSKY